MFRSALLCAAAVGVIAIASACQPETAPAQPPAADTQAAEADEGGAPASLVPTISCDAASMFNAATTRQSLIDAHGAENITDEKTSWVDSEIDAVTLWANDPTMTAQVLWYGDTSVTPIAARVQGGPESLWVGPQGLLLGATVADIEAANGGPFLMTAFENHNHGEVSNFLGGKLEQAGTAGCSFHLALNASPDAPQEAVAKLSGDSEKTFRSDSPELRAVNPVVVDMTISFAQ